MKERYWRNIAREYYTLLRSHERTHARTHANIVVIRDVPSAHTLCLRSDVNDTVVVVVVVVVVVIVVLVLVKLSLTSRSFNTFYILGMCYRFKTLCNHL